VKGVKMDRRSVEQLGNELSRLMAEQIASLEKQTFLGFDEKEFRKERDRLKRIRELSADYLAALKRGQ
jgi:hypothetical protein